MTLTEKEKLLIAGCAAGATAAAVPAVCGAVITAVKRPISDRDFLRVKNGGFISDCGEKVSLRGINLNDDIFGFFKADLNKNASSYDVFAALEERFGNYGARQIIQKYSEGFITPSDIKRVAKLGANCVRIPLRYKYLFKKDSCKDDIDFENLDKIISKCKKSGLYVILELHSAPGFQNTDSACGKDDKSVLFSSGKDGFDSRNATVRIWTQVAAHYKDEPAVAAYDLLNRPLNRMVDWENKLDTLHKFYKRLYKAIRTVDKDHIVILEAAGAPHTLPSPDDYKGENIAYGLYNHFFTTFETDSLINGIRDFGGDIPFVICKLRSEESLAYSLEAMNNNGISWLAGDYKGEGLKAAYLYGGNVAETDLTIDSYDEICENWPKAVATKNFEKNKEMASILKKAFDGKILCTESGDGKPSGFRPEFNAKLGFNLLYGKTE